MPSTKVRRGLYWSEHTRTWHYEFRLDGTKHNGNTGHTLEKEARAWLAKKREAVKKAEVGWTVPSEALSLAQGLARWLEAHAGASPGHQANVRRAVELHAKALLDTPMDQIHAGELEHLRVAYLRTKGLGYHQAHLPHSTAGADKVVHHVRLVLAWCGQRGLGPGAPPKPAPLWAQQRVKAVVWPEQVQAFIAEADRGGADHATKGPRLIPHSATAIRLLLALGLREEEALGARWEWFDTRRQVYRVGRSKNGGVREVPVPEWLSDHLEHLRTLQGGPRKGLILPMSLDKDGHQVPHQRRFTAKPVARCAAKLQIHGLTPHRLRATFATAHFEAGTPLSQIQQMLGHEDPETTMRYIVQRPKDQAEAQEKVAQAMGFSPQSPPTVPPKTVTLNLKRILRVRSN
jgi:integrase